MWQRNRPDVLGFFSKKLDNTKIKHKECLLGDYFRCLILIISLLRSYYTLIIANISTFVNLLNLRAEEVPEALQNQHDNQEIDAD